MFKYNEIIGQLIKEIRGTPAHTKLPSRHELCLLYKCTRTTIDRAISELTTQGYLYSQQGSGTFVASDNNNPQIVHSWAFIVQDIRNQPYAEMLRGITDLANKNGIGVQIYNTDNDLGKQQSIIKSLKKANIEGLVIVPVITSEPQYEIFMWLKSQNIPFVFCNRGIEELPEIPLIRASAFYGGYLATKLLFERGYKRPAYISYILGRIPMERLEGYMAAIDEQGREIYRNLIVHRCFAPGSSTGEVIKINDIYPHENGKDYEPLGYLEAKKLLQLPMPPDSFFCSSEATLEGVYKAVRDTGLEIPGNIGITSYDNSPICKQQHPQVTAVSSIGYEIGHKAAIVLHKMMKGEAVSDFNRYILHPIIIERESCLGPGEKV